MLVSVSLLSVLVTVLTISTYLILDIRTSKQQELTLTAAVAADRNRAAVSFLDKDRARENLNIYQHNDAISSACLYDSSGALFAGYQSPSSVSDKCPSDATGARTVMRNIGSDRMAAVEPLRNGRDVLGSIFLISDTRDIETYINKIIQISATVTALVLAFTLLVSLYIQRRISAPILKLAELSEQIAQTRDFSLDMKSSRNDEIGKLAHGFNAMLKEVRQRDMELRYVNETLEHKVLLRTRELEEAKRLAEKANEAKTEFLRNISHEFRTPLHAMISFSTYGIKESDHVDQQARTRYFQIILKSSERLSRLVDDVLDVARYEECTQQFNLRKSDMNDLISRAADSMRPLMKEKRVNIELALNAKATQLVCDQDRIIQVLTNIIGNAIKFSPNNSRLVLTCDSTHISGEPALHISCRDQGVGIPTYETDAIFEPFRQSSTTNTGAGGTGLGLSICRGIIHAHSGIIKAENNSGAGATVSFTLPTNLEEGARKMTVTSKEVSHEHAA
jgi:signal transduction histidine kinase